MTTTITPAEVRGALILLSAAIQADPYGDPAKYGARYIVREIGTWIRPYLREVIDHSMAAEDALREAEALQERGLPTLLASDLWDYQLDVWDLQVGFVELAAERAAERAEWLAQYDIGPY